VCDKTGEIGFNVAMIWIWIAFIVFILAMLAMDLGVFNRKAHAVSLREAFAWTGVWVSMAMAFNVLIYFMYQHHWFGVGQTVGEQLTGSDAALKFFTGYIIEESLSLDNIFVIALILAYFRVPQAYQHRVLFWGVLGAMVMRGVMIALGVALIRHFSWITYVFGGILIFTAIKMLLAKHDNPDPDHNPLVRLAKRWLPVTDGFRGQALLVRENGRRMMTPLMLVLLTVESTDLLFAVDSVPAIFAVTTDPFIVFTSNIFAILGLRSMYFALAAVIEKFRYLKTSLMFLLGYIGVKMLLIHHYEIPTVASLGVIAGILGTGVVASIIASRRDVKAGE